MQWNNALPDKTLSVSNEGMNAKKVKKSNSTANDKWEKKSVHIRFTMENYDHAINTFVTY